MITIFTIIGALLGILLDEMLGKSHGFITGGVLGCLVALMMKDRARLIKLEKEFSLFKSKSDKVIPVDSIKVDSASSAINKSAVTSSEFDSDTRIKAELENAKNTISTSVVSAPIKAVDDNNSQSQSGLPSSERIKIPQSRLNPQPHQHQHQANIFDTALNVIKRYFTEGNPIVRVGIVVLFFGVSFLVKYSIDNALLPIEIRLSCVMSGAMAMLVIGWRLRLKAVTYALIMQGGAIAIMFLTVFASFKLYHLISASFAFPLLIVLSFIGMFFAVIQNSRSLAISAISGGFLSPILVSTGSGDHVALFGYYMILNVAIFSVSWFKSWRMLNVIGFLFTFIIGTVWGVTTYKAANFATTEPFLIGFFLIYVAISIVFAFKQSPDLRGYVDGTLVFGVPMVGFGLQAALVKHMEYGLAWSSFSLGIFYLLVTKLLWNNSNKNFRLLCEAMLALGMIFASLTIPFALDGRWTAASWAIEGAGLIWIGMRQQRRLVRYFGVLVQVAGGILFLMDFPYAFNAKPFINGEYLGIFIVSVAGLFTAYIYRDKKDSHQLTPIMEKFFLLWGLCWWYAGGILQLVRHLHADYAVTAQLLFMVISLLLWLAVNLRVQWKLFGFFPWLLVVPLMFYTANAVENSHVFAHYGYIVWPCALLSLYLAFYCCDKKNVLLKGARGLHDLTFLMLIFIVGSESYWQLVHANFALCWIWAFIAALMVFHLHMINRFHCWPFTQHPVAYQKDVSTVLIAGLLWWTLAFNFFTFLEPTPLPYIPIVNPLDIVLGLALMIMYQWYKRFGLTLYPFLTPLLMLKCISGLGFIWVNVILFKIIHVAKDVPYQAYSLFNSDIVQTSVAIFWTLIGLVLMVCASKKHHREMWLAGAVLTGIVVAKLFLLDLSARDTVERIVSFLIVGILLLVVGYFAPVPPGKKDALSTQHKDDLDDNSSSVI